jgi:hypothetical protein
MSGIRSQEITGTEEATARELAGKLITFLETGTAPAGLFAPDVFVDFTMPLWRLQAQGARDAIGMRLAGHPGPGRVPRSRFDAGEIIDRQALTAYRSRLRDIDEEFAEAQAWADDARAARLRHERDALRREVSAAVGLGGRRRRFSSADERARVAVRKAISAALARIGQRDAALARLLRDSVRTGRACRSDPDPARPVTWVLESAGSPQAIA